MGHPSPSASSPIQPLQQKSAYQRNTDMATDKDNDDGPVRERARDELLECQSLVRSLFDAHAHLLGRRLTARDVHRITPGSETKSEPVHVMEKLIVRQKSLRKFIDEVIEHQRLYSVIEELRAANAVEDAKIAQLGANLRAAESVLQNALDEARPRMAALKRANKRPVDVDEVISYGSKISASLSAPAGWDVSQPLGNYLPPAPSDDMMRGGRLATLSLEEQEQGPKATAGS